MLLVVDANVLIDFAKTDPTVLALAVRHVGEVFVLRDVLAEVDQLDEEASVRLGLTVLDGTLEQVLEAGAMRGPLSFADWLCLIVARDAGWTCVSNDGRLRRECDARGIPVRWGLQVVLDVVEAGALEPADAIGVAEAICRTNHWIGSAVLAEFKRKVLGK
jgi:predicted nucleic acid-binding protein